jgi:hypothetical protein
MIRNGLILLMVALVTASCGGGGGGSYSGSSSTPVAPSNYGMTFSPATISLSAKAGGSMPFMVTATPSNPSEFSGASTIYVFIVDNDGVINPNVMINSATPNAVSVTLSTSSAAKAGQYSGNMQVKVCADSACNSPFPGSPWNLPYSITITP